MEGWYLKTKPTIQTLNFWITSCSYFIIRLFLKRKCKCLWNRMQFTYFTLTYRNFMLLCFCFCSFWIYQNIMDRKMLQILPNFITVLNFGALFLYCRVFFSGWNLTHFKAEIEPHKAPVCQRKNKLHFSIWSKHILSFNKPEQTIEIHSRRKIIKRTMFFF